MQLSFSILIDRIGSNNAGNEDVIGTQAMGHRNDNGDRLISFCSASGLKIGGSLFQHKQIHKGTWRSPDGNTVNQIDHICVSRRWISSLQDVRAYRGADVASDHYMIVANLRIKLKTICRQQGENPLLSYNVAHLKDEKVKTEFDLDLKNRFQAPQQEDNVEDDWFRFKDTVNKAADSVLGRRRGKEEKDGSHPARGK